MSIISVQNLRKTYIMGTNVVNALQDVSVSIDKNEYVALMGPSGSGKSTLMNLLGCLDTPSGGKYVLNGTDVSEMEDGDLAEVRNKEIGFVFQTFNLLPRLSALDNVALPLVYSLSGGQRQRVAIARALVNNPSIILADEPTGNLDTKTSIEIMGIFEKIHDAGNTVILVTHEPDIADHAHRIVRLRDGLVEKDVRNENIIKVDNPEHNYNKR